MREARSADRSLLSHGPALRLADLINANFGFDDIGSLRSVVSRKSTFSIHFNTRPEYSA